MRLFLLALVAALIPTAVWADEFAKQNTEVGGNGTAREVAERAVERSARFYRIKVYEQFRTNRAVYNRFSRRGSDVLTAWQAAADTIPAEDAIRWFETTKASISQGVTQPPQFPRRLEEEWLRIRAAKKAEPVAPALPRKSIEEIPVKRSVKKRNAPKVSTPTIADLPLDARSEPKTAAPREFNFEGAATDSLTPPAPPARASSEDKDETDAPKSDTKQPAATTSNKGVFKSFGRALLRGVGN